MSPWAVAASAATVHSREPVPPAPGSVELGQRRDGTTPCSVSVRTEERKQDMSSLTENIFPASRDGSPVVADRKPTGRQRAGQPTRQGRLEV